MFMTTLTDFLLDRIAEDEQAAREALRYAAEDLDMQHRWEWVHFYRLRRGRRSNDGGGWSSGHHEGAPSPARVLAECEAKRRIVELHREWPVLVEQEQPPDLMATDGTLTDDIVLTVSRRMAWMTEQAYIKRFGIDPPTGRILVALAQPYADHPDFNPVWTL